MKISVLTPTYNREKLLERLYKSLVKNSKYGVEIEWLIMDDGSTDQTEQKVKSFIQEKEPHIQVKYYKQKNQGKMIAINNLVEKATGEYIMFLDSDDYIDKKLYGNIKKYIDEKIELIKYKMQRIDENDKILEIVSGATFDEVTGEEGFNRLYGTDVLLDSPCVYIIKKDIFTRNNLKFKVGTEHEDFGLIPFIIVLAKSMVSTNFYGYYYVQSQGSLMRNENYQKTIKRVYDALGHYDNAKEYSQKINISKLTHDNIMIYYTNAVILKAMDLKEEERKKYLEELKNRKVYKNIKARNLKQMIKKILLMIDINLYLKLYEK